ncbi:hypothetical protein ABFS82_11G093200 [Erythranthe guttata]|nr:PREDICTED: protein trichome birefringence-like 19 [Erythranthe guttata]|eukprot:XP_012835060.1 PREDICTED: protein trichome birefringence-like 19 [Erythranthe guttata]
MELLLFKKHGNLNKTIKKIVVITAIAIILLAFIRINNPIPHNHYSNPPLSNYPAAGLVIPSPNQQLININIAAQDIKITDVREECDVFAGEWVPNPDAPYYTNDTCWAIHEHQNCMKYGRPDSGFLKWKWKPDGCDLDVLNPFQLLDIVRGRSLAFVGDSVGRNQLQSMICLLSRVEYPIDVSPTTDEHFKRWKYVNYNFTLAYFWSPFLIRSDEGDPDGPTKTGLLNLYLDEPDESWATQIDEFDYVILNAGHWFTRPAIYHEDRRPVGCRYCQLPNLTDLPATYAYRRVFRTALRSIAERVRFNGVAIVRTYAPSHFEGGLWDAGGNCVRQRPYRRNETELEGSDLGMYEAQLEEFMAAAAGAKKRFRLMDTTAAMQLRPDGHPSRYGHWPEEKVGLYNDCVHWCLPGPIDTWADFLQHMIKMEARISYMERKNIKMH